MGKKKLPIGIDDFGEVRKKNFYFVDKSLIIRDFLEIEDKVALIARPRRFGKTLCMSMIRDFLDITKDSRELFKGLTIMDTEYAECINSRPVAYLTFKNCRAQTASELVETVKREILGEYIRHEKAIRALEEEDSFEAKNMLEMVQAMMGPQTPSIKVEASIGSLLGILKKYYGVAPVLLIDEYDQPVMSSYKYGYHHELGTFFSNLYGIAMKGNDTLGQALLTGVQRVVKESIFSQFNNLRVYTVLNRQYAPYFGLTQEETRILLEDCGLELNEAVKKKYDGYQIGSVEVYNPWSILNYADTGLLEDYWVNTAANFLIRRGLENATRNFWKDFDVLATGEPVTVWLILETSYAERDSDYSLWGLLVNAGYLTVMERIDANSAVVRIPNEEVLSEFRSFVKKRCTMVYETIEAAQAPARGLPYGQA